MDAAEMLPCRKVRAAARAAGIAPLVFGARAL
jgi:hypothetical protein